MTTSEVLCTPVGEMRDQLTCRSIASGQEEQVVYCEVDDLAAIK